MYFWKFSVSTGLVVSVAIALLSSAVYKKAIQIDLVKK
jgi:hypothetical protein